MEHHKDNIRPSNRLGEDKDRSVVAAMVDATERRIERERAQTSTVREHAHTFLEEASGVMKQRAVLRDKPEGERSMAAIVKTFNALTGHNLTEAEGWEFMILLKMVRGRQGKYNRDDYVDMSAYSGLLGECKSSEKIE